MKVRITRLIMVAAIAALVVMGAVTPVLAQSPNFPNFSSVTNLTFNGNAAQSGTVLQLTPAVTFQDGVCLVQYRAAGCRCFFHHVHVSADRKQLRGTAPQTALRS